MANFYLYDGFGGWSFRLCETGFNPISWGPFVVNFSVLGGILSILGIEPANILFFIVLRLLLVFLVSWIFLDRSGIFFPYNKTYEYSAILMSL